MNFLTRILSVLASEEWDGERLRAGAAAAVAVAVAVVGLRDFGSEGVILVALKRPWRRRYTEDDMTGSQLTV